MTDCVTGPELRVIGILADLPDDDLAWIADQCDTRTFETGDLLFQPGATAEWMYFALEGTVDIRRVGAAADAPNFLIRTGDVSGRIPFSRMKNFQGTARALSHGRVALFPASKFTELLRRIPVLEPRLVGLLTDRVRDTERRDQEYERFLTVGRMSAGIAHELNNPVAAAQQAVTEMARRIDAMQRFTVDVIAAGVDAETLARLVALRGAVKVRGAVTLDPIERSERTEQMTEWLGQAGVPEPWVIAGTFVNTGVTCEEMAAEGDRIPARAHASALCWLEAGLAVDVLVRELAQATARVADLVSAIKSYTQMDRPSALETVDVREGLEAAISVYRTRLAEKHIRICREYDDVPPAPAYVSYLNQVWDSLLSNAIDAVPDGGSITLRTTREDAHVRVDIADDGPGVPPELQERVWEPFFTTKDVGQGAGMGLDIARRIVQRRHSGSITMQSAPGDTVFSVRLPLT